MVERIQTNRTVIRQDANRLRGQNAMIYEMLKKHPRTNVELASHSLKYTSRISDIRKWLKLNNSGTIVCSRSLKSSVNVYALKDVDRNEASNDKSR